MAQTGVIRGRITAPDGSPLPGASVNIKGRNKGAVSIDDGTFSVHVQGTVTLVVSALGYDPKEVDAAAGQNITVALVKNTRSLDEVVVTALGVKRDKRNLTYSTQEVKGDELVRSKESNVLNALTGKVAGVSITNSSGTPGGSASIVIRGVTSLLQNNQALIVVDGQPIDNSETGGAPDGGPGTNRLADIDPATIESVNILKGAAATALYGSDGGRGVVMITTRKGEANKRPTITFSSDIAMDKAIFPERQLSYAQGDLGQYIDGEANKTSVSWGPKMDTLHVPFHNPFKEFFKTGWTSNNSLSVSGGGSNSGYFLSYSYYDQTGTVPKDEYKRHNVFAKFNSKILDNLTATFQLGYTYADRMTLPEGYGLISPVWTVYSMPVSYNPLPYLNPDGTQRLYRYSRNSPYWIVNNVLNTSTVNHFLPQFTFNYTPTDWLSVTERLGADIYTDQQNYHVNIGDVVYGTGYLVTAANNSRIFNHDLIVQAHHQFGQFNTSLLLGNNLYSNYASYESESGKGMSIPGYYNMANASSVVPTASYYQDRKVGFYGQFDEEYNRMLVLTLTGRYDGLSVLSSQHQFFPYGSGALGFIFSELFSPGLKAKIPFAKLRASYGIVGDGNVPDYSGSTPYYQANIFGYMNYLPFPYNGQNGFLKSGTLGNPNLRNEIQHEFEAGLETKMLDNRVGLEVSYFSRNMLRGLVSGAQISNATGYTGTTLNSAEMQTKGVEALLNLTPVRTRNFSWDMTLNYSRIRNKVTAVAPGLNTTEVGFVYATVGQPWGVLYGNTYARAANGEYRINAGGLPYTDSTGIVGNIQPSWTGGMLNTFRYKQFSLSFFMDVKHGGQIFNQDDSYGFFYGTAKATENRDHPLVIHGISDATGKENTQTVDPETYYKALNGIYEAGIQSASYIKLRNVSLSYSLSRGTLGHTPFREVTFVLTGKNLWIYHPNFTGSDPEVSSYGTGNGNAGEYAFSTPTSRTYAFTVRLGF